MSRPHVFGRVTLQIALTALLTAAGSAGSASQAPKQSRQLDAAARADGLALVQLIDEVEAGGLPGGDAWLKWTYHFLRAPGGKTYIPFILSIDEAPDAFQSFALYVRVVRRPRDSSRPSIQISEDLFADVNAKLGGRLDSRDIHPDGSGLIHQQLRFIDARHDAGHPAIGQGAFALLPGPYDVYVAVRERSGRANPRADPRSAVMKQELNVPALQEGQRLTLSSVVVVDRVDPLPAPLSNEEQLERPYALGSAELIPASDLKFARTETLSLMFFVYNARLDARALPDVVIRYRILHQFGARPDVFGETAPQVFRDALPATRGVKARRDLPVFQAIPLRLLPPGPYRLEIEVTDKAVGETASQAVDFSID